MNGLLMKYFVLTPLKQDEYGLASKRAMLTYADSIELHNPELAKQIQEWLADIEERMEDS